MSTQLLELEGLHARVDRVVYKPQIEAPAEKPYPFVYYITITNNSTETVTIKGRKWVVTDTSGDRLVVEGDGVVGLFPRLEPGEHFSYNSYHVIGLDSVVEGAYLGITDKGEAVFTRIPRFELQVPTAAN